MQMQWESIVNHSVSVLKNSIFLTAYYYRITLFYFTQATFDNLSFTILDDAVIRLSPLSDIVADTI